MCTLELILVTNIYFFQKPGNHVAKTEKKGRRNVANKERSKTATRGVPKQDVLKNSYFASSKQNLQSKSSENI